MDIIILSMRKVEGMNNTKAFVDIQYGEMKIKSLSVVDGSKGLFVSMPREKGKDEKYYDIVHPISEGLRRQINEKLIDYYLNEK